MTSLKNYIFFLGGYDLEMETILFLLSERKCIVKNNNLTWGAKLSEYKKDLEEIKEDEIPVLIELTLDINHPSNAIIIDHHNDKENKPSSLEQIAELLNLELNRWQKLVAANDRGHIRALNEICASENEIREIRKKDKDAQGVTEEDESLAKKSIDENKREVNGATIIRSLSDKFSPITDLMYGKTDKLLIYNNNSLLYIGNGKPKLVKKYKNLIDEQKAFYGGGEKGYFGMLIENNNEQKLDEVIETLNKDDEEKIYSYHIFLFPFKWKHWDVEDKNLLKHKFDIKRFHDKLLEVDENETKWKRKKFSLDHYDHYNEYNYFYEYVREILYDLGDELNTQNNDKLINHFEYKISKSKTLFYHIKLCDEKGTTYNLEIDSILLNVYSTGTAVLSFHLRNKDKKHSSKEDILKINKFGRRLYVPFFDLEPDSIYTGDKDKTDINKVLSATKHNEIPDAIWIGEKKEPDKENELYEDFEKYRDMINFKHGPFLLPKFIEDLFPGNFFFTHEKKGYEKKIKNENYKIDLRPVLDDRMHVVCWYGNSDLVNELNKIKECNDFDLTNTYLNDNRKDKNHYSYELSDWWYSYIFVDSPAPMQTDRFSRKKLVKDNTYSRWVEYGTLYGLSRYSFVMLTGDFLKTPSYLVRHLQTMYYKMAELCLLQRATVLSFSDEVTHVSNLIDMDIKNKQKLISDKISSLYKHYILFVNKIYFREVTAQEQGIEMYDMMQKIMRLPSDVKDLDNEIDELNRYASMQAERDDAEELKRHTIEANNLTKIAALFLVPALIAGILGMNTLPEISHIPDYLFSGEAFLPFWSSLILLCILSIILINLIGRMFNLKFNFKELFFNIFRKKTE